MSKIVNEINKRLVQRGYKIKYLATHAAQVKQTAHEYYIRVKGTRRQLFCDRYRAYAAANPDKERARKKLWRENNVDHVKEYNRKHGQMLRNKDARAKFVCPTYVYLMNLRKTDPVQFTNIYKLHERIVAKTSRECNALHEMNAGLCPLVTNSNTEMDGAYMAAKCPMNSAVFKIENAAWQITQIAMLLRGMCRE